MAAKKNMIVDEYARMWPREVFDCLISNENGGKKRILGKGLDLVNEPGVYVLYRDDIPLLHRTSDEAAPSALVTCGFSRRKIRQFLELLLSLRNS
jgi:hypothetical protein